MLLDFSSGMFCPSLQKSDVAEPILESPPTTETPLPLANSALPGDKTTPRDGSNPHIYQSLDAVGADGETLCVCVLSLIHI